LVSDNFFEYFLNPLANTSFALIVLSSSPLVSSTPPAPAPAPEFFFANLSALFCAFCSSVNEGRPLCFAGISAGSDGIVSPKGWTGAGSVANTGFLGLPRPLDGAAGDCPNASFKILLIFFFWLEMLVVDFYLHLPPTYYHRHLYD
jgi:hypothetical protein